MLPRAAARKQLESERQLSLNGGNVGPPDESEQPSFRDMLKTFTRLLKNPTLMFNNLAAVFYYFGYLPYWIFTPKYIEIQYHQSASVSSLVTGTVALTFSAVGVLLSGVVISKFKPRARYMAAWNVLVGALSVAGMIGYIFLGCPASDNNLAAATTTIQGDRMSSVGNMTIPTCFSDCNCDYVKYSPVCGEDDRTYISACHAGCSEQMSLGKDTKLFTQCSCIEGINTGLQNETYLVSEGTEEQPPI